MVLFNLIIGSFLDSFLSCSSYYSHSSLLAPLSRKKIRYYHPAFGSNDNETVYWNTEITGFHGTAKSFAKSSNGGPAPIFIAVSDWVPVPYPTKNIKI